MEKRTYKNFDEEVYYHRLDNGLQIYLVLKKDYKKYFCSLGVKYGSNTNRFVPRGEKEYINVPLGIAHFLEHKKFDLPKGIDASNVLAENGIDSNAYTTFVETVYLVTGTTKMNFAINYLLDFVQEGYFNEEDVIKEQGIIEQEIKMYLDSPRERVYYGLLSNMFLENEIKYDIAGNLESIHKIDKKLLEKCYNTFYHPSNMVLCLVGSFDPKDIIEEIATNQRKKYFPEIIDIKRKFYIEDGNVHKKSSSSKMDIIMPKISIGVKIPYFKIKKNQLQLMELLLKVIMESTIGSSTPFYQELLDEELIGGNYSYSVSISETASFIRVNVDTPNPKLLIKKLRSKLLSIPTHQLDDETFERYKKVIIGSFIRGLNSVEEIATSIMEYHFRDSDMFEVLEALIQAHPTDVDDLRAFFDEDSISDYTIYPN